MSNEFTNPIAEVGYPDSGWIVTPGEAEQLKRKHNKYFFCPDYNCKDRRLSVKRSSLGKIFFSHHPGCGHDIKPETLLHKLAVKWFEGKTAFEIPAHKSDGKELKQQTVQIDATQTRLEYNIANTFRPDVILQSVSGFTFAVEIVVTNDVNNAKAKKIDEFKLPTLRIDLSRFYQNNKERCQTDKWFIQVYLDKLLTDITLKSWVLPPKWNELSAEMEVIQITEPEPLPPPVQQVEPEPVNEPAQPATSQSENGGCFVILPLIGVGYLFYTLW